MAEFEQIVKVTPAYDKRSDDPKQNYGIGACRIVFILKGPKGATQFMIGTSWYVPSAREHILGFSHTFDQFQRGDFFRPDGWDVGYHSPKPMYDSQTSMKCDLIEGGQCFYDGSGLRADDWVPKFIEGGTDWLWKALENEYRETFEAAE